MSTYFINDIGKTSSIPVATVLVGASHAPLPTRNVSVDIDNTSSGVTDVLIL
jgi:hypothetical protein